MPHPGAGRGEGRELLENASPLWLGSSVLGHFLLCATAMVLMWPACPPRLCLVDQAVALYHRGTSKSSLGILSVQSHSYKDGH